MNNRKQSFRTAAALIPPSEPQVAAIVEALLRWGPKRDFPWRSPSASQFHVLIAEILTTRTPAEAVANVVVDLWRRFPTPFDLANASNEQVAEVIAPLGLGKRTGQLRACAKIIRENGIPTERGFLTQLPGVGPYVADAFLAFALDRPVIAVDSVVGRVLRRVLGYASSGPAYDDVDLWRQAQHLAQPSGTNLVLASLLDLGALICLPKRPLCSSCPLVASCVEDKTRQRSE